MVKFCKSCISGMGGSIELERKECESIGCWTRYVNSIYNLDFQGHIWHGTKGVRANRKSVALCYFDL